MYHAILLVCAMANTMTLCARGYEAKYQQAPHLSYVDPNIPPQGQLHLPINHIESYTPYHLFAKQHPELTAMQYETLIKSPADDKACYYPLLATPTNVSKNYIELSINPGAYFHDGSNIKVEDIAYSIQMAKKSLVWQQYSQPIRQLIQYPETFRIEYTGDWHEIIIALGHIPIVQKKTLLGSGPYQLSQQNSQQLSFIKQDHYWGKSHWLNIGRNLYHKVIYHLITHPALLHQFLSTQTIDLYPVYNAKQWHLLDTSLSEATTALNQNQSHYTQYLLFNPETNALKFRQAIFSLINAAQINQYLCFGQYQNIESKPISIAEALSILSESKTKTLQLVVLSKWLHIGEAIAHQLQQHGVKTELITLPTSAYVHRLRLGQYDLTILGTEHHPLMQYSDLLAAYIQPPIPYHQDLNLIDYQNQLIEQHYLHPLWKSSQYKIHHDSTIKLDHLDGLDELDLLSSWKIK